MRVLVVVDMQKDFVDGALGTQEAQAIVPAVVEKIRTFDGLICATMDTHTAEYASTQEGHNLPVPHCIDGTPGWEMNDAVFDALDRREDWQGNLFRKPAFGSVELMGYLREQNEKDPIQEITLIGLCTDICVISNAMLLKAALPEVPITVDAACCAGVTPESHKNALAAMKMCQICIENEA